MPRIIHTMAPASATAEVAPTRTRCGSGPIEVGGYLPRSSSNAAVFDASEKWSCHSLP
jgi:hypothetical protein